MPSYIGNLFRGAVDFVTRAPLGGTLATSAATIAAATPASLIASPTWGRIPETVLSAGVLGGALSLMDRFVYSDTVADRVPATLIAGVTASVLTLSQSGFSWRTAFGVAAAGLVSVGLHAMEEPNNTLKAVQEWARGPSVGPT